MHVAERPRTSPSLRDLEPGAVLVLGQSLDPAKNGGAPVGAAYRTHLILNNDNEQLSICFGPCATVSSSTSSPGNRQRPYDGHALIVDPVEADLPATDPFGTAGDCGTPGLANPACEAPDASTDQVRDGPADFEFR